MNPALARALRWILTTIIVAFLIVFARTVDWTSAWSSIRTASLPLLLAAVVINFISIAVKGVRWWLFLRPAGVPSLGLAVRATIAGAGLNNVVVANGGDAARVVFVSRATGVQSSTILATLALERLFDPVGFVILLVYGVMAYELPASIERWALVSQAGLVGILGLLVWFVYVSRHHTEMPAASAIRPHGFFGRIAAYLAGFAASTRSLTSAPRFAGALVISMLGWAGQIATFQLAASAAHASIPPEASLAALLATNLGLLLRATPGNVGFFQFVFALTVVPFGIDRDAAIAVSLLIQTIQILPVTAAAVVLAPEFIFRRSVVREEARALAKESEPAMLGSVAEKGEKLARAAGEA